MIRGKSKELKAQMNSVSLRIISIEKLLIICLRAFISQLIVGKSTNEICEKLKRVINIVRPNSNLIL